MGYCLQLRKGLLLECCLLEKLWTHCPLFNCIFIDDSITINMLNRILTFLSTFVRYFKCEEMYAVEKVLWKIIFFFLAQLLFQARPLFFNLLPYLGQSVFTLSLYLYINETMNNNIYFVGSRFFLLLELVLKLKSVHLSRTV